MRFATKKGRNKYGNVRTKTIAGVSCASKKEAKRYDELLLLQSAGEIFGLQFQPRFKLHVNGVLICSYVSDFLYHDNRTNNIVVEDTKGKKTKDYIIKAKMFQVLYPQYTFIET